MLRSGPERPGWGWTTILIMSLALATLLPSGCTRRYFRQAADRDVEEILTEKNIYPQWLLEKWWVYPDPMARFADPSNPDRPPKPFDDPAAEFLSPNPQKPGRSGQGNFVGTGWVELIQLWDSSNRQTERASDLPRAASSALPPPTRASGQDIREPLKSTEKTYLIKLEQSNELAQFNSREFQDRREDLYLAALAVTLERFAFAAQFFAGGTLFREWAGKDLSGDGNRWGGTGTVTARQLFPTGALLLFRFANQFVLDMASNTPRFTIPSQLSLDITQPLLRGGGYAVNLEPLTQVERNLLYNLRYFSRWRKLLFVAISGGGELVSVIPGGGFLGAASRLPTSGLSTTEGYLPTMLRLAILNNERNNVSELERILTFYRQLQGGGDVSPLQTDQVLQQLLSSRSTVLQREQDYRNSVDRFKLQLGIPTNFPLELDDEWIHPLNAQLEKLREIFDQDRAVQTTEQSLVALPADQLRAGIGRLLNDLPLVQGTDFQKRVGDDWQIWVRRAPVQIEDALQKLAEEKAEINRKRIELDAKGELLGAQEVQRSDQIDYLLDLGTMEQTLRSYETAPWRNAFAELGEQDRALRQERMRLEGFQRVFSAFIRLLSDAREERLTKTQNNWPGLPGVIVNGVDLLAADFDQAQTVVAQTALTNRLDLMNVRGEVVDAWRQVAVDANALLGVVNVQYHLDGITPALTTSPFGFSGTRTSNRLTLSGELPLVRRLERNNYRTALINFQRQRRILQGSEDVILLEVRDELRQLRVLAENFRIQQRAIAVAYSQRDNSLEVIRQPSRPGESSAANAAALTQQLLSAQSRVPQTENLLYTIYVNYLVARMTLYRDLELMQLDARGVWCDDYAAGNASQNVDRTAPGPEIRGELERLPEPRTLGPGGAAPR